jgi:hypothetical protein
MVVKKAKTGYWKLVAGEVVEENIDFVAPYSLEGKPIFVSLEGPYGVRISMDAPIICY